jgi:proteasome lid subunit RPN8/RPN11
MKPYVLVACRDVPIARRQSVPIVLQGVPNVALIAVKRVLKMIFVQTVKKKWRYKMNNKNAKTLELPNQKVKPQRKQVSQKSSWELNYKVERLNENPVLRFSPTAWAKLLYFRDKLDNEVGGFGITDPDDLLFVTDFVTVKQEVTAVSVKFDDEAVASFFDNQVDLGRKPEQFARIWLHSHPADCPEPSTIDEETFHRVFGRCQWAVMFVVAQNNKTYARLRFNVGPGGQVLIPVEINYICDFEPSNHEEWDREFEANIKPTTWLTATNDKEEAKDKTDLTSYGLPYDFLDEFEKLELPERQLILDELAERPDLWDEDEEVMFI